MLRLSNCPRVRFSPYSNVTTVTLDVLPSASSRTEHTNRVVSLVAIVSYNWCRHDLCDLSTGLFAAMACIKIAERVHPAPIQSQSCKHVKQGRKMCPHWDDYPRQHLICGGAGIRALG